MTAIRGLLAVCVVAACSGGSKTVQPSAKPPAARPFALAADAAAGVTSPQLKKLLVDHWDWTMRQSPVWATTLGDHRFDDRLADNSATAIRAGRAQARAFLRRARALDRHALDAADRLTLDLFIHQLDVNVGRQVCVEEQWNVTAGSNVVVRFNRLPTKHKVVSERDGANLVARYRAIGRSIDNTIANLRRGAAAGLHANAETVRRAIKLVDDQLAKPVSTWALLSPLNHIPAGWTAAARDAFSRNLTAAVADSVRPAYTRYRDFLRDHMLAEARGPNAAGIGAMPNGKQCYAARLRYYTGLAKTAAELHATGEREIARIDAQMAALGKKLFNTDLPGTLTKLRTSPELYYNSAAEVLQGARDALAAAKKAIPNYFGILPRTDCVVRKIPDYEAKFSTIAYYMQPHYDGSKPGEYYVNAYKPKSRPRFEMRVLSFHESIPGHHLQIAIAMERNALPAFRKLGGTTAFVEGWALYAERLADEMHLYPSDLDRMGMLSYDAWRAARLVVDTGIHAMGWTRARAEKYMREHTALTDVNIRNEVDRYIAWPGQAVAYKVGQLFILGLRAEAKRKLGQRFDIKAFHDQVLKNGAVTLPVLRKQIDAWMR